MTYNPPNTRGGYSLYDVGISGLSQAVKNSAVSVVAAATALPAVALVARRHIIVYNNGTATIYVGTSTVTVLTGMPIVEGASLHLDLSDDVTLYGIAAAGAHDVRLLEIA